MTNMDSIIMSKVSNQADKGLFQILVLYGLVVVGIRLIANLLISPSWLPIIADFIALTTIIILYFISSKVEDLSVYFWPGVVLMQGSTFFLWFGLGGIQGPTIVFNLTLLVLYLILDNKGYYWQIGLAVVSSTLITILLEQLYPSWIVPYTNKTIKLIDTGIVFIIMIAIIVLAAKFMKHRYEKVQNQSDKKAKELTLEKQKTEENRDLLATLNELQSSFLLGRGLERSFDGSLKQLLRITNSQYGFIGEIIDSEEKTALRTFVIRDSTGLLKNANLLEDNHWQENGQSNFQSLLDNMLMRKTYVLSDKVPNIGGGSLTAFLGFPIVYDNTVIGIVGVANKSGYEEFLIQTLAPLLSTYGTIIQNIRFKRAQQKYEKELREAKEVAEQAVQAKNHLFTNISHELRTPLSLIVGPVSAILKQPQGTLVEKDTRSSLNMVLRNSQKVLQYIDNIMDLAKLNSNKLEILPEPNHWYSFIHGIYHTFQVQTAYREIDYKFVYKAPKDLILDVDRLKMEKIINNLLSNAFKYTPDGGQIVFSVIDQGTTMQVEVRDTGVGIEPENVPYIFDRFYQTKAAEKSSTSSTGIGLALAQELAILQGFEIEVVSVYKEGTCFSFDMPKIVSTMEQNTLSLVEEAKVSRIEDERSFPLEEKAGNQKPRVLIVEDNRDMAVFVKLVLGSDYDTKIAENGAIGWAILQKNPTKFDLVITDLMMPEMDGYQLLKEIKTTDWGVDLPVIVLTAKSGEASRLKALTIGVDEYLTKPFSVDELTIHVKNLIENSINRKRWKGKDGTELDTIGGSQGDIVPSSIKETKEAIFNREKIERARNVVLENIDETEFAVDDLARALMVSKRQLYRFMQLHTGLTPLKFINEIRLQEARRLLEEGLCNTVKEVSYSIGFMSTRHFSKNYSTRFGKKPSEYFR